MLNNDKNNLYLDRVSDEDEYDQDAPIVEKEETKLDPDYQNLLDEEIEYEDEDYVEPEPKIENGTGMPTLKVNTDQILEENKVSKDAIRILKLELDKEREKNSLLEEQSLDGKIKNKDSNQMMKEMKAQAGLAGLSLTEYRNMLAEGTITQLSKRKQIPEEHLRAEYHRSLKEDEATDRRKNVYVEGLKGIFSNKYGLTEAQTRLYLKQTEDALQRSIDELPLQAVESFMKGNWNLVPIKLQRERVRIIREKPRQTVAPSLVRAPIQPIRKKQVFNQMDFAYEVAKNKYEELLGDGFSPEQAKAKIRSVPEFAPFIIKGLIK